MKNIYLSLMACLISIASIAQVPTDQQKLLYTCKVWGFVKYYHSSVSVCQVNWDSVLLARLPLIKNAVTNDDFNDALDSMLAAAGPMALTNTPPADTMTSELKRNLDFGWINDPIFRHDVKTFLDTVKNNFRPHDICWVHDNDYSNSYGGWLVFPHDSLMLDINSDVSYPDEWHRLLLLFKHWNIVSYFNPYNYVLSQPWDSAFYQNVMNIDTAGNDYNFFLAFKKLVSNMSDAHVQGLTYDYQNYFAYGPYKIKIILKHIPGKYVVVSSAATGIHEGDEIISIAGLTAKEWEDSLKAYISAGDSSVFRRTVQDYMLCGGFSTSVPVSVRDSSGTVQSLNVPRNTLYYSSYFNSYYPNDTLAAAKWKYWSNCNIGYVNMGLIMPGEVADMYYDLQHTSAIIFDIRNYPNGTAWPIANFIYPSQRVFSKLLLPDVTFPGTYFWADDYLGNDGNTDAYDGKVIILMNEETQSQAEFSCMILEAMPDVVKVGSQTAGADGNITYYRLTQNIQTGFTTLGVFYPNGDSTQRIGIVPDSLVYPTQAGIRQKRDEVLEKALEIAECLTAVSTITADSEIRISPNPFSFEATLMTDRVLKDATIIIYNSFGQAVREIKNINQQTIRIQRNNLPCGMYFVRLVQGGSVLTTSKLIITGN